MKGSQSSHFPKRITTLYEFRNELKIHDHRIKLFHLKKARINSVTNKPLSC